MLGILNTGLMMWYCFRLVAWAVLPMGAIYAAIFQYLLQTILAQ